MKVLWFTNTPCGASELLNPSINVGGWLRSLENQLHKIDEIELYICFYWHVNLTPFKHNKTYYIPVYRPKIKNIINKVVGNIYDKHELMCLKNVINEIKPNIIHIHGTEENYGLIQKFTTIPVVISLQGILSPYTEKYFSGISGLSVFLYEDLLSKILFKSELILFKQLKRNSLREKEILSMASHIIGRTEWDKQIATLLAPHSQYYLGNEILRSSFYFNKWKKRNNISPFHIVTTMSGGLYKGLETIIKAAAILKGTKNVHFTWTVIGQKETDSTPRIVKRWLNIDFSKLDINLVGNKNENEIIEIMQAADLYCQTSHIENSPNSVCEAMLLGIPIIASFAGGTSSILENDKEGMLIQDGDPYSLAGAIFKFFLNPDLGESYSYYSRRRAQVRHNPDTIAQSTFNIYHTILSTAMEHSYNIL